MRHQTQMKEEEECTNLSCLMKDTITLMRKDEVDAILATANMKVLKYNVRASMHCYIAEKQ